VTARHPDRLVIDLTGVAANGGKPITRAAADILAQTGIDHGAGAPSHAPAVASTLVVSRA